MQNSLSRKKATAKKNLDKAIDQVRGSLRYAKSASPMKMLVGGEEAAVTLDGLEMRSLIVIKELFDAIVTRHLGRAMPPFRYRDKGTMATIGRNAAIATVLGKNYSGYPAWIVWLGLHLHSLIGFRNRVLVLLNWAYYYLFYER